MSADLTQKEILLRLMDKVEKIDREQTAHISFAKTKLETIETQALKTNGRVTKLEEEVDIVQIKQENAAVKIGAGVFVASVAFTYLFNQVL